MSGFEYAVARSAFMPDMSGKARFTIIYGPTDNYGMAEAKARSAPTIPDHPAFIIQRPVGEWARAVEETEA